MSFATVQAEHARLLLGSLADAGVRDVVVSPGSRSTPFLLAAMAEPRLELITVIDERSAAFVALGQARVTGRPSLLLCTSGTAGANYFPAVIEASMANVPLLVLTADRPLELVDCGANQTIDQHGLFGGHVRAFVDLGLADGHPDALAGLRRAASRAVTACTWPTPGAVHLNARARKPLEPTVEPPTDDATAAEVDRLLARPLPAPIRPALAGDDLAALGRRLSAVERGLIVAGPGPVEPLHRGRLARAATALARHTGWPLAVDLSSQMRSEPSDDGPVLVSALDLLFADDENRQRWRPDLILQLGRGPTSAVWGRTLRSWRHDLEHWVVSPADFPDAESTASHRVVADLALALDALPLLAPARTDDSDWTASWRRIAGAIDSARGTLLAEQDELSEAAIARAAVRIVPENGLLMVGNSLPVRLADIWSGAPAAGVGVLSQRGASGIDGLVSGAAGAARASGAPTLLVLGDVSLRHDLGGLATAPRSGPKDGAPFCVLVVHNGGGRIFERLPVARHPAVEPDDLAHWLTPSNDDFAHAAAHFGLAYHRVTTTDELDTAFAAVFETATDRRPALIEARVPAHGALDLDRQLRARIESAVRALDR